MRSPNPMTFRPLHPSRRVECVNRISTYLSSVVLASATSISFRLIPISQECIMNAYSRPSTFPSLHMRARAVQDRADRALDQKILDNLVEVIEERLKPCGKCADCLKRQAAAS